MNNANPKCSFAPVELQFSPADCIVIRRIESHLHKYEVIHEILNGETVIDFSSLTRKKKLSEAVQFVAKWLDENGI